MYPVSDYYLKAIERNSQSWCLKCDVRKRRKGEVLLTLTDEDLESDSLSLSHVSTSSSTFTIGGVSSKKITLSLTSLGIFKLKKLDLLRKGICFDISVWILTDDANQSEDDFSLNLDNTPNETGKCHLGYFYIYSVKNSDYSCSLELYDAMLAFARDVSTQDQINLQQGYRTIESWLSLFCTSCSDSTYELEVAPGLADRIANKETTFTIDRDQTMDSYRNAIGFLSILAGGFAVIQRDGTLDIVSYAGVESLHIEQDKIFSYEMSEETYVVGELRTSIAGFNYTSKTSELVGLDVVPIFVTENPFLRGRQPVDSDNLSDDVKSQVDFITAHITGLNLRGGTFEAVGRPEIDLGDCISFTKRYVNQEPGHQNEVLEYKYSNILVCSQDWSFQGSSKITCINYGDQSASESSKLSSSFKSSSGGPSSGVSNSIEKLVGLEDIHLTSSFREKLFNALFLLKGGIGAYFTVTVTIDVKTAGDFYFESSYDNVTYFYRPRYTRGIGKDTLSFSCYLEAVENDMQHSLIIEMVSEGVVIDIAAFDYQLIVMSNGISSSSASWTGRFEVIDRIQGVEVEDFILYNEFSDSLDYTLG